MIATRLEDFHGPPDLVLGGFQLWVHWLERDEDQIEGDWLVVSACCESSDDEAWFEEMPVLQLSELRTWLQACELLNQRMEGEATLKCQEPNLSINARMSEGAFLVSICITPDHHSGRQEFAFNTDPSCLPSFLDQGRKLLEFFPLAGARSDGR